MPQSRFEPCETERSEVSFRFESCSLHSRFSETSTAESAWAVSLFEATPVASFSETTAVVSPSEALPPEVNS